MTLRPARHYPKEEVTADEGAGATFIPLEVHLTDRVSTINPILRHMVELHQISRNLMTDVANNVGEDVVAVAPVVVGEETELFPFMSGFHTLTPTRMLCTPFR